jgi:hypothetical protein
MSSAPAVIVNKGGFFSAVAKGLFSTITAILLCGTALGLYGMYMVDKHFGHLTQQVLEALPEWQHALPPVLADALNDRRAPEYRQSLDITTRYVPSQTDTDHGVLLLDIQNKGQATVSLLSLRLVVEDESNERFSELSTMAASPLPFGDHPGPLQPGSTREIVQRLGHVAGEPKAKVEVSELRVWNGPAGKADEAPGT